MLLIAKHFNITFGWTLVRLSNLIYHIQKTVPLRLFSYSQSVLAVNKTLSLVCLLIHPFCILLIIND